MLDSLNINKEKYDIKMDLEKFSSFKYKYHLKSPLIR